MQHIARACSIVRRTKSSSNLGLRGSWGLPCPPSLFLPHCSRPLLILSRQLWNMLSSASIIFGGRGRGGRKKNRGRRKGTRKPRRTGLRVGRGWTRVWKTLSSPHPVGKTVFCPRSWDNAVSGLDYLLRRGHVWGQKIDPYVLSSVPVELFFFFSCGRRGPRKRRGSRILLEMRVDKDNDEDVGHP